MQQGTNQVSTYLPDYLRHLRCRYRTCMVASHSVDARLRRLFVALQVAALRVVQADSIRDVGIWLYDRKRIGW
jgi:hypothetical protein